MTASLLAIDVGTTPINFGVLDDDGTYPLVHSADGQTVFPEPGAAIQEPDRVPLWRVDADQLEFTLVGANLFVARGLGMGTDSRIPARRDNQPGNARSGPIKETLATLSAGTPDASCVERDRHVKLLDGNTWPMS